MIVVPKSKVSLPCPKCNKFLYTTKDAGIFSCRRDSCEKKGKLFALNLLEVEENK